MLKSTRLFWVLILAPLVWSQSETVIPWVAQKDATWKSFIAINNHGSASASVQLEAVRAGGQSERVTVSIPAGGHYSVAASTLFTSLGSGSGYCVFIQSDQPLTAGVKVASQATASGDSPALGQGVALEQAAPRLVLPYLPYESGGASAPVLVNVTDETASVTLRFVGGQVLDPVTVTIPPRSPLADVTTNLFPGLSTSGYMEAESNVPLVGAAFNFNALREPSMAIAQVQSTLSEEDLDGLISSLETSATLMNSYATSSSGLFKQSACPEVDVDINLNNQSSFITGHFDWGSGCTNVLGVYHSGSIDLTMQREGTIQTGGWMNGSLVMDNFTTKYLGSSAAFNGSAHAEGSTKSQNFTLSGSWSASADVPAYYLHASFSSSTYLSVNHKSDHYEAYGSFQVKYQTYYYGSIVAEVAQNDPLIYDFETCIWPTDGKLMLTLQYGIPLTGSLDFGTGDCNTAVLTVNGVSQTLYLPGIYTKQ